MIRSVSTTIVVLTVQAIVPGEKASMFRYSSDLRRVCFADTPPGVAAEIVLPDGGIRQIMDDDFDRFIDEELPEVLETVESV